ncbi:uncharacterized protein LOC131943638 isoform X1 [Physella acuta]|uniref:uncharacterized protein LOC131943638 isoform X1 n=2 Tax=Physella acuta TaxID=109671 RepID=UPI0027DE30DA|nr:uncharacterized protein LOC131943638 isoform X1 [Physella acuta]
MSIFQYSTIEQSINKWVYLRMGSKESCPITTINKDAVNILPCVPATSSIKEAQGCRPDFESVNKRLTLEMSEDMLRTCTPLDPMINVLLIGKSGNGKSATANTIVGHRRFSNRSSGSCSTQKVDYHIAEYEGHLIKVVDGLSVCNTRLDNERSIGELIDATKVALAVNPEGYHAFLFVLKYGNRFTYEEQVTVQVLKKIFGDNFVRDFGILIITCGDIFQQEQDAKDFEALIFNEWCQSQDGAFRDFMNEFEGRILLFDNTYRFDVDIDNPVDDLISTIERLLYKRTYDLSERIQQINDTIVTELKKLLITGEATLEEASATVDQPQPTHGSNETEVLAPSDKISPRTKTDQEILAKQEELTKALESLEKKFSDESAFSVRYIEEMKTNFEKELKNQREKYENLIEELKHDQQKRFDDINRRMQETATQEGS